MWTHLKGESIRTLAKEHERSLGALYKQLKEEIETVPTNEEITLKYCGRNRWSGVLLVDAKYVKVKGYDRKIAFIYGIDYLTHDIPVCLLAITENYQSYKQFFTKLKNSNYKLRGLVSDEHDAILPACKQVFGERILRQVCHTHFLENIRRNLRVRSDDTYKPFVGELKKILFNSKKKQKKKIKQELHELALKSAGDDPTISVLININDHIDELTNHLKIGQCPKTNNLIESYNKQLNGRLKTILGFESFQTAKKWLNAWILARRLTPFTDCRGSFKKLNGKCSLELTKKSHLTIPDFLPKK